MRSKSLVLLCIMLSGCAHVQTRIQTVHCVTPKQYTDLVKAKPAKVGHTLTGNAQQDFKIVAESDVLVRQYADGLLDVIGGCTG